MNETCSKCTHMVPRESVKYEVYDTCGLTGSFIFNELPKDCPLDENEIRRLEIRLGWLYHEVSTKIGAIERIERKIREMNKAKHPSIDGSD